MAMEKTNEEIAYEKVMQFLEENGISQVDIGQFFEDEEIRERITELAEDNFPHREVKAFTDHLEAQLEAFNEQLKYDTVLAFLKEELEGKLEEDGTRKVYFDYRESVQPEMLMAAFDEYRNDEQLRQDYPLFEYFLYQKVEEKWDISFNEENNLMKDIKEAAKEKGEDFAAAVSDVLKETGNGILYEAGYEGVTYDLTDILKDDYHISLMLTTPDEKNHGDCAIDFYDSLFANGDYTYHDSKVFAECANNAVTYLVHQQGHTVQEVFDCIHSENRNESESGEFIQSLVEEIESANSYYSPQLTVLVSAKGEELLDVMDKIAHKEGSLEVPEGTTVGLYDKDSGSGSSLEIMLEEHFSFQTAMIDTVQIEGANRELNKGYSADETYGLVGEAWKGEISPRLEEPVLFNENEDMTKIFEQVEKKKEELKENPKEYDDD